MNELFAAVPLLEEVLRVPSVEIVTAAARVYHGLYEMREFF